jgi:hypothetical protein
MKLRYLFKAEFTDGTFIQQTQEDVSLLAKGRNQWYDVLNSGREVAKLTLVEQKIWNPTVISVDLITGNFTLNDKELFTQPIMDSKTGKEILVKRKPFRNMQVKKHLAVTYQVKTGKVLSSSELPEERIFYIGWEAGKYKQVIGVK